MGKSVVPLNSVSGFHGAGPVRRALGMRLVVTARESGAHSRLYPPQEICAEHLAIETNTAVKVCHRNAKAMQTGMARTGGFAFHWRDVPFGSLERTQF